MRFRTLAAFCLGTSALTAGGAHAASTDWSDGTGSWFTSGNWTNGVPGAGDDATIGNGGTAQIGSGTAAANSLSITNGSTVALLSGGTFNVTTVNLNGTFSTAATTITTSNINFNAGTNSTVLAAASSTLNLTGNLTFNTSASDTTFIGSATATGTVAIASASVIAGANAGALEIVGGTLKDISTTTPQSAFATALGNLKSVTIDTGATLEIDSNGNGRGPATETYIKLFGGGQLVMGGSNQPRVVLGDSNFSGQISGAGYIGIGGVSLGTSPSTVILTGNNNSAFEFQIASGSVLQIGNGGTSGSIANTALILGYSNTPTSNAVLRFNRSDNITLGSALNGSLVLQQSGTGILTVSGNNSVYPPGDFYGSVVVSSGGLSISSDHNLNGSPITLSNATTLYTTASGSFTSPITVSGNTTFNVAIGTTANWSGRISDGSSAGSMQVTGGGTLILTGGNNFGQNVYTGTTTISSGTLQLGNGGNSGAIVGPIVNNGVLAFNLSGNFSFSPISGSGSVVQMGSGTTVFQGGAYTYSGGTTITNGTLQIGYYDNTTITGNVLDNANITFQQGGISTFGGVVSGTGSLTQDGGKLMLTGTNTYTGGTVVKTGILVIGNGGTGGSIIGDATTVLGTLSFQRSDTYLFAGNISHTVGGFLTQSGTGTLILTGNINADTTVNSGILQVGNGGSTGTIVGGVNVNASATFAFNRSGTAILDTTVYGNGFAAITGPGTVVLVGSLEEAGGTTISNGTLQVGDGVNLGYLRSNVTDNSALVFNRPGSSTVDINISGTGSVAQSGTGTLIFTGANTYTGPTIISSGVLQVGDGTNGHDGAISNTVIDNGALVFDYSNASSHSYAGAISGTGSVTQSGASTLILTGANTYTGGTTINSGATLRIGSGGSLASTGPLTINGGILDLNVSGLTVGPLSGTGGTILANQGFLATNSNIDSTLGASIVGANALTKLGTGTLTLTGVNTFFTPVILSGGALQIGNGGTLGSLLGNVTNNAKLIFNRSDAVLFSNLISGSGAVTKLGAGALTLSGSNTYTGSTTVSAGTLNVTGSIGSSAVSVASGATLSGTGTVGATVIANGGTLAPGNSIGTLSVNGNLTMASGSIYSVEVSPTAADRTIVSGTASVNGTVAASVGAGTYAFGQRFAIITAAGGVTGSFASLTGIPTALKGQLSYDANNAYLTLSPNALAPQLTNATGNQQKLVSAIDASVAAGNVPPAGFVPLYTLSGASLNSALDQISGQAAPNAANAVGQGFLSFLSMAAAGGSGDAGSFAPGSAYGGADAPHRAQLGAGQARVWGAAYGGHVGLSGNSASGAAGLSSNNVGMIGGADMQIADGVIIGATLGLGRQLFHSGNGSGDSNDFLFGLYGRANAGAGYVAASFGLGWHQIKTLRVVTVSGTDVLQGKQNADDYGGRIEAGWRFAADDKTSIIPYGAFAGESFESPAYAEAAISGASTFALSYGAQTTALGRSELGARLDRNYALEHGTLTADLHAAWAHQLDDQPFVLASFQNLPGSSFQVAGVRPGRDTALLGLDLEVQNSSGLFFGVRGEGQFGTGTTIVEGLGNLGWRW